MGFAAGGIGAGGAARMPSGGRIAFGVFSGGAMFSGDHTPAGKSNLAALIEATSRSGSFSFQAGYLRESQSPLGIARGRDGSRRRTHLLRGGDGVARPRCGLERGGCGVRRAHWRGHPGRRCRPRDRRAGLSSFGLALRGTDVFTASDALDLSLSQPLRIESGSARIDLPAGRSRFGETLRERIDASLEPSGRELDLCASHSRSLGSVDLRVAAGWVEQRGHVRSREGDPHGLIELRRTF